MANDKIFCEKKKRSILGKTNEVWDSKKLECVNLKKREKRIRKWDILLQMHWRAKEVKERKYNYRKEDGNSHQ